MVLRTRRASAWILAAVAGLLLLLAWSPAPASADGHDHGFTRECGDDIDENGAGWYDVQAFHANCKLARNVARRFWNNNDRAFNGWHCFIRQIGDEVWKANCTRYRDRHQHVRFEFGA